MTKKPVSEEEKKERLSVAAFLPSVTTNVNPWSPTDVDKLEDLDTDNFREIVKACRFFYKHDSIVSTVINKLVDISITDLIIPKNKLSANEYRIISALKGKLQEYAENIALEYLISGLIVPEIKYANTTKEQLKEFGIKKYETLTLPVSMWLRDPMTIIINSSMFMDEPSYFVEIPENLRLFITNNGTYSDGTKDEETYRMLLAYYPEFVMEVKNGAISVLIDNPLIVRRRYLTSSPYPIPYLTSVVEPLKHKRNLRRMDYATASRVIGAIQLFKLGSDEFPVTQDQEDQFDQLRDQMYYRYSGNRDLERIFQLFANHTLQIEWIYPPIDALLNDKKYAEVNQDIMLGLGFPRILMTGEVERSGTSNAEYATMSPIKTMENLRAKILKILNNIVDNVIEKNKLKGDTTLRFSPINMMGFEAFVNGLSLLYNTGNLSRTSYANAFGYDLEEEFNLRSEEKELMDSLGIEEFEAQPFSPQPGKNETNPQENNKNSLEKSEK